MSSRMKLRGYTATRVVALGTGAEEGDVLIQAEKWGTHEIIVVALTGEFLGELAKHVGNEPNEA